MRWPLARIRAAGRRSVSSGARRVRVSALVVITLSGLRRSWPSTAVNISAMRRLSVSWLTRRSRSAALACRAFTVSASSRR